VLEHPSRREVAGQLAPVESGVHFAFAWLAFNPASEIAAELP
jgi:hypothetical protein